MVSILLVCDDVVGTVMAGPAIRYWELARTLARRHAVTLYCPNDPDVSASEFRIVSAKTVALRNLVRDCDLVIAQRISQNLSVQARRHGTKIIFDAYDPILLELLEVDSFRDPDYQRTSNKRVWADTLFALRSADAVICASEKQRDLWLGALMAADRIRPDLYKRDPSLRNLIDVVPFGLPSIPPSKTGPGFRERLGLSARHRVLLWGGGIWNWFDPLTLIQAVHQISQTRDDVVLVFMGTVRPNADVPEMEMAGTARRLADDLGLTNRYVFFNDGWVPYDERQNHLLEADIGVSHHFDHVETRFSFRTRILDYIWAGLPIIATEGDTLAELITTRKWGLVVPYQDVDALSAAIVDLLDDPAKHAAARQALQAARGEFRWDVVTSPLEGLIESVAATPTRRPTAGDTSLALRLYADTAALIYKDQGTAALMAALAGKAGAVWRRRRSG